MLELLRAFAVNIGVVLLVYAGFALIERGRPAERGQPFSAVVFNIEYLLIYQLINLMLLPLLTALAVEAARHVSGAFGFSRSRFSRWRVEDRGVFLRLRFLLLLVPPAAARLALPLG
jgi:hypothetical protein